MYIQYPPPGHVWRHKFAVDEPEGLDATSDSHGSDLPPRTPNDVGPPARELRKLEDQFRRLLSAAITAMQLPRDALQTGSNRGERPEIPAERSNWVHNGSGVASRYGQRSGLPSTRTAKFAWQPPREPTSSVSRRSRFTRSCKRDDGEFISPRPHHWPPSPVQELE